MTNEISVCILRVIVTKVVFVAFFFFIFYCLDSFLNKLQCYWHSNIRKSGAWKTKRLSWMVYILTIFWNKEERTLEKEGVRVCLCECVYETCLRGRGRSLIWPLTYYVFGVNREGCAAAGTAFSDIPPCTKLPFAGL